MFAMVVLIPVQVCSLHRLVCSATPLQVRPPFAGFGLLQYLDRDCNPPPQVTLHDDHPLQPDQSPFT